MLFMNRSPTLYTSLRRPNRRLDIGLDNHTSTGHSLTGQVCEVRRIRENCGLDDPPNGPLSEFDFESDATSQSLAGYGLSAGGFFDSIRVYRVALKKVPVTNSSLKKAEKELKKARFKQKCSCVVFFLILPLLFAIPILTTRAMTEVKNGMTLSNPFPWFLPDSLLFLLLFCLFFLFIVHFEWEISGIIFCCTVITSIFVLLIFLFEWSANHRFIEQLSIDAMSAQQSDNQQTSADQPLSPDEVEQPESDLATEPSDETTSSTQRDERSARQLDPDDLLKVAQIIAETIPNIEPTTISRIIEQLSTDAVSSQQSDNEQHSNSSKTPVSTIPIPRRARIPLKTLAVPEAALLSFSLYFIFQGTREEECLMTAVGLLILMFVCPFPVVIALKGMQLIRVRWTTLTLPLLVVIRFVLFSEPSTWSSLSKLLVYLVPLLPALIANGILILPFVVWTLPLSLLVFGGIDVFGIERADDEMEKNEVDGSTPFCGGKLLLRVDINRLQNAQGINKVSKLSKLSNNCNRLDSVSSIPIIKESDVPFQSLNSNFNSNIDNLLSIPSSAQQTSTTPKVRRTLHTRSSSTVRLSHCFHNHHSESRIQHLCASRPHQ
ncbi:hypothetical protein BLNAU_11783 [Blattamonas nauphoetae]|uniref:Uncharacterized protein n=1 Tax=Blattamonas nauphoetae TaxID=2049346 RepID=A0ABQ9XSA3_9EUKA|nr:hypothetical protein BLNAU_11783 [Blattamonas nauphoetae]